MLINGQFSQQSLFSKKIGPNFSVLCTFSKSPPPHHGAVSRAPGSSAAGRILRRCPCKGPIAVSAANVGRHGGRPPLARWRPGSAECLNNCPLQYLQKAGAAGGRLAAACAWGGAAAQGDLSLQGGQVNGAVTGRQLIPTLIRWRWSCAHNSSPETCLESRDRRRSHAEAALGRAAGNPAALPFGVSEDASGWPHSLDNEELT